MKPTKILEVIIWCNEPSSGHFSGYLTGFDVGVLQFFCRLQDEGYHLLFDGDYLLVEGEKFYFVERQRCFANLECDRVLMPAEAVCRLVNWALVNEFDWHTISTSFRNLVEDKNKISIEDLRLIYFSQEAQNEA